MANMHLILKGIRIAITIALIMFFIALSFSFINDLTFNGSFSFVSSLNFFIGMLGYGSVNTESMVIHIIISFTGIVMVSFLTAYLTMNLFMREKIFIFKKIVLWQIGSELFASFFIVNSGDEIAEVEVSFATFINKKVLRISGTGENYSIPYMPKNGHWKIDIPIKLNSYIHESLDKVNKAGWILYISVKYTDVFTGQKFTNIYKYSKADVVGSKTKAGLLYEHISNKRIIRNIILDVDDEHKENILQFIHSNIFIIDNRYGESIGYGTKIDKNIQEPSKKQSIVVKVDWKKIKTDNYGMLLYKFSPPIDLRKEYRKNGRVEFDLKTNRNIKSVTFEIKKPGIVKFVEVNLEVNSDEYEFHSLVLSEKSSDVENFAKVDEICFLIREHQIVDLEELAVFEVSDLKIVYDKSEEQSSVVFA